MCNPYTISAISPLTVACRDHSLWSVVLFQLLGGGEAKVSFTECSENMKHLPGRLRMFKAKKESPSKGELSPSQSSRNPPQTTLILLQ